MLPKFLTRGEHARLFPVLAVTSKEGRTTSVVLACLSTIDVFGKTMLSSVGQKLGVRASVETYTEITFPGQKPNEADRPDGLIDVHIGSREWRALVEAKVGQNTLSADQIERYRVLAKAHDIDCVITISNQFTSKPQNHPMAEVRKSRSKIPVFHWSWMYILTQVDLLLGDEETINSDQAELLRELRRFLAHDSAGVKGFTRMPPEWSDINKLVSSGGKIQARAPRDAGHTRSLASRNQRFVADTEPPNQDISRREIDAPEHK